MCFVKCERTDSNILLFSIIGSDQNRIPLAMIQTMKKLKSGYINGTRVMLGNLNDFLNTSAITDLSFLGSQEDGYPDSKLSFLSLKFDSRFNILLRFPTELNPNVQAYLDEHLLRSINQKNTLTMKPGSRPRNLRRRMSVKGAIKKTRSINVDCEYKSTNLPCPLPEPKEQYLDESVSLCRLFPINSFLLLFLC